MTTVSDIRSSPSAIEALRAHHFVVERQAVPSPRLREFIDLGGQRALSREGTRRDCACSTAAAANIYATKYPERLYGKFAAVAPARRETRWRLSRIGISSTLTNRSTIRRWTGTASRLRFLGQAAGWIDSRLKQGGASTLATQIEKISTFAGRGAPSTWVRSSGRC